MTMRMIVFENPSAATQLRNAGIPVIKQEVNGKNMYAVQKSTCTEEILKRLQAVFEQGFFAQTRHICF